MRKVELQNQFGLTPMRRSTIAWEEAVASENRLSSDFGGLTVNNRRPLPR